MSRPTARVLSLLELLQSGGVRTVAELAGRLEVDERTVRRYVDHLIDLDVPVESVRGRYGGDPPLPPNPQPPPRLTDAEAPPALSRLFPAPRTAPVDATLHTAAAPSARDLPLTL